MYWLQRPPHLRRIAAAALILAAFAWDLHGSRTERHPFAAHHLSAGTVLGSGDVSWRRLPVGAFPVADIDGRVLAVDLAPGDPVTAPVLAVPAPVPDGWWAVPLDIGPHALPGDDVLLVITDPAVTVAGIVVGAQHGDPYSLDYRAALVAVPGDQAALVAAAERAGALVTATRP